MEMGVDAHHVLALQNVVDYILGDVRCRALADNLLILFQNLGSDAERVMTLLKSLPNRVGYSPLR